MKTQVKKVITLSGGAAILVLAIGFGGHELSPSGTTTRGSSTIAPAFRPRCSRRMFHSPSISKRL